MIAIIISTPRALIGSVNKGWKTHLLLLTKTFNEEMHYSVCARSSLVDTLPHLGHYLLDVPRCLECEYPFGFGSYRKTKALGKWYQTLLIGKVGTAYVEKEGRRNRAAHLDILKKKRICEATFASGDVINSGSLIVQFVFLTERID